MRWRMDDAVSIKRYGCQVVVPLLLLVTSVPAAQAQDSSGEGAYTTTATIFSDLTHRNGESNDDTELEPCAQCKKQLALLAG